MYVVIWRHCYFGPFTSFQQIRQWQEDYAAIFGRRREGTKLVKLEKPI